MRERKLVFEETFASVFCFLKISNKNGLRRPRETTENILERILQPKYAKINLGYLPTYRKIVRKLFIKTIENA